MYWKVSDMRVGDFISVQVVNKKGDRNLDGTLIKGTIVELVPSHNMVKLESGWCCHTKDKLLKHLPPIGDPNTMIFLRKFSEEIEKSDK